jgi:uncharacterized phage-associated protein
MANVFDVAEYILQLTGRMTTWKLQKLVYYSQAWSLVWDQRPLFPERIEAWANGPVCPDLYAHHRGQFVIEKIAAGDPNSVDKDGRDTIDGVLNYYGDKHPQWLSDLTHAEGPWKDARGDLPSGAPSHKEITLESMVAYYEAIPPDTFSSAATL